MSWLWMSCSVAGSTLMRLRSGEPGGTTTRSALPLVHRRGRRGLRALAAGRGHRQRADQRDAVTTERRSADLPWGPTRSQTWSLR